jgi:uncharacterized protein YecE (DUF72 family)
VSCNKPLIYVGTSGWLYDWNIGGTLDWYIAHSRLNAVELNASFYRFPYPNQVKSWARRGRTLRWSIKIHRSITHTRRLNERAYPIWDRFRKLFEPMENEGIVDFYLLQLPPSFDARQEYVERIKRFAQYTRLGARLAIEFRHDSWFRDGLGVRLCRELGATFVSIDAPIGTYIDKSNDQVYLRIHGRYEWYAYDYSEEELRELAEKLVEFNPKKIYVFFNNDHWMLENARTMLRILKELVNA